MILTLVAWNRPWLKRSRRSTSDGICSSPFVLSHHSAPTTRPVSVQSEAA
jgi:hypothetical protein